METKPPLPPFSLETARQKVQAAEDAWNSRDPERVALAYTPDSEWRNRAEFFAGRDAIKAFLQRKWAKELEYRLKKELWCFTDNRIGVRFEYEWHDDSGNWFVRMAMRCGSLPTADSCSAASRVSTTSRSKRRIASCAGHAKCEALAQFAG